MRSAQRARGRVRRRAARLRAIFTIVALAVLGGAAGLAAQTGFLDFLEYPLVDLRFASFNPGYKPSQDLVFVDVDETSLQSLSPEIGGWPWPRGTVVADHLLGYIMEGGPSAFLFDVLYPEYSPKSPGEDIPDEDLFLFELSLAYPEVSHAVLFMNSLDLDPRPLPDFTDFNFSLPVQREDGFIDFPDYNDFILPFDPLADFSPALHAVNYSEDPDGISRRMPLLTEYQGSFYPSLALRGLERHLGVTAYVLADGRLELYRDEELLRSIPLDETGDLPLVFYRDYNEFSVVPADVVIASSLNVRDGLEPLIDPEEFRDKIVVFGGSATGLRDIKLTPIGRNVAGPYLHLNAISNVLQERYLTIPSTSVSTLFAVALVVLVLLATLVLPGRLLRFLVGAVLLVAFALVSILLFRGSAIMVEMAPGLFVGVVAYLAGLFFVGISESRERHKIAGAMGKYLAPEVMTEVLENYDELVGEVGEEREIAILFSDIRGFTSISERHAADVVVSVLNRYLARMIGVVFAHQGTLDKMIGDAVMAFWGAPNPTDRKDYLAVAAALAMHVELADVNRGLVADGFDPLEIGVGVNTGPMIIGNIGSERRLDYTAIGDNVNLGSRIEGLTKYYKCPILVSEATREKTADDFRYVFVDTVAVKGKEQGIAIYRPLGAAGTLPARLAADVAAFEEGIGEYAAGNYGPAGKRFGEIDEASTLSGLAGIYRERCDILVKTPPRPDWDGIWRMVEK